MQEIDPLTLGVLVNSEWFAKEVERGDMYPVYGPGPQERALELLMLEKDSDRYRFAKKVIRVIAFHYGNGIEMQKLLFSTTPKQQERELLRLAKAADEFNKALQGIGFDTIGTMYSAGNWYRDGESYKALKKQDDAGEDVTVGLIVGIIKDMAENARTAATKASKPKGGRPQDIATTIFVMRCRSVFETYRPGLAASTEGGDFREFVSLVHEMGTGEKDKDFERPIKKVLSAYRAAKGRNPARTA